MNSEKSQGDVLKAVLQAKENNQIEGIYGRMGDLGAIDGKHIGLSSSITFRCHLIFEIAIFSL